MYRYVRAARLLCWPNSHTARAETATEPHFGRNLGQWENRKCPVLYCLFVCEAINDDYEWQVDIEIKLLMYRY